MAVTLLALVAIHRRRVRSRRMIEEWEEEDEIASAGRFQPRDDGIVN